MANTILTHKMIARRAADMLVNEDNFIPNINTGYDGEFGSSVMGYKRGDTVKIGIPPNPATWTGSTFVDDDVAEDYVNLTVDHQIGAGLKFTAVEKSLDVDQFTERFLRPAINSVRSQVQAYLIGLMTKAAGNAVGTSGTTATARKTYAQAQAALDRALAPTDRRTCLISSDANVELVDANAALFNPRSVISPNFTEGYQGRYAGFDFGVNQLLSTITGNASTAYVVATTSVDGDTTLDVSTGTGAIKAGTIFTVAGVNAVNPVTGDDTGELRQFTVTEDSAGGTATLSIWPAIVSTGSGKTVTALPTASDAITIFDDNAAANRQGLAFQKNAFAAAFAPLPVLASCEGHTATSGNVSVRVMSFGDGANDLERTRVDVLCGGVAIRPGHICRITE